MGWRLKALAVLVGLMLISLGAWPVSALLFLYAFSSLIFRGLGLRRGKAPAATATASQQGAQVVPAPRFRRGFARPGRRILGLACLALSAGAFTEGGIYSPLVFGGIGAILLLWGSPLVAIGSLGALRPVDESILLRRGLDPIHWLAIAEVKLATKQVGKALGGIDATLIISSEADGPSIFVVLNTASLTMRKAEESLISRLRELARVSAPLGAYLLPVDPEKAVAGLRLSAGAVDLDSKGWPSALSTTDYDLLTVETKRGGFVHSVGAYKLLGRGDSRKAAVPLARQTFSRPALLWEVFQELGRKVEWRKPDGYTTFLASMFATGGETIGERVSEAGAAGDSRSVLVQSLGTPPIQLSRAQLRAIAGIYA